MAPQQGLRVRLSNKRHGVRSLAIPSAKGTGGMGTKKWWRRRSARVVIASLILGGLGLTPARASTGGTITGTVTDPSGHPIANTCVAAHNTTNYGGPSVATDSSGRYALTGVPADTYRLAFGCYGGPWLTSWYDGGYDDHQANQITVADGSVLSGINATLILGGTVAGTVADDLGAPAASVRVSVVRAGHSYSTVSNSDGRFTISGLRPGVYKARLDTDYSWWHGSDQESAESFVVASGRTVSGISFASPRPGSISGTITGPDGQPLTGACVTAFRASPPETFGQGWATSDAIGGFRMDVPAGSYQVAADDCANHTLGWTFHGETADRSAAAVMTVSPGEAAGPADIQMLAGAAMSGTITAEATGAPVPDACVSVWQGPTYYGHDTTTDADGHYRLSGLASGAYGVYVSPCGDQDLVAHLFENSVTLTPGTEVAGVDFAMAASGTITGVVTDDTGAPVAGACVQAGAGEASFFAQADDAGRYAVRQLETGSYGVSFSGCGATQYANQWYAGKPSVATADQVAVTAGQVTDGIDASLQPARKITGTITDAGGHPLAGACVQAYAGSGEGAKVGWDNFSDGTGRYSVEHVGAGSYQLLIADCSGGRRFDPAWYGGGGDRSTAVSVSVGSTDVGGLDITVAPIAPIVEGITATAGYSGGGDVVAIVGNGLGETSSVRFGDTPATSFTRISRDEVDAVAPAGAPGTVDVTVTTPVGTSATSAADRYTYLPKPVVTGLSPNHGPRAGGTSVTISGTGFAAVSAVSFGPTAATSFVVVSDSEIDATAPAGPLTSGTVDVHVTAPSGTSDTTPAGTFTYDAPIPTVTDLSPSKGPEAGGTTVTVVGAGFTGATAVTFGSVPASWFSVQSDTTLQAGIPAGTGSVSVAVTTAGGTSAPSSSSQYGYVPRPTVASVSPNRGAAAGGTNVVITGSGFSTVSAVKFGGAGAQWFWVVNDNTLYANAPAGTGVVHVSVQYPYGWSLTSAADLFTYRPAPTITALSPASGPVSGGTVVTMTGTSLGDASSVVVGGRTADYQVISEEQIQFTTPSSSAGNANVVVTTTGGSASAPFRFMGPPVIWSLSPNHGLFLTGTTVTIHGLDMDGATAVLFGTTPAASFVVNDSGTITAVAPRQLPGTVDVRVTTPLGQSATTAADRYTYDLAPL